MTIEKKKFDPKGEQFWETDQGKQILDEARNQGVYITYFLKAAMELAWVSGRLQGREEVMEVL